MIAGYLESLNATGSLHEQPRGSHTKASSALPILDRKIDIVQSRNWNRFSVLPVDGIDQIGRGSRGRDVRVVDGGQRTLRYQTYNRALDRIDAGSRPLVQVASLHVDSPVTFWNLGQDPVQLQLSRGVQFLCF